MFERIVKWSKVFLILVHGENTTDSCMLKIQKYRKIQHRSEMKCCVNLEGLMQLPNVRCYYIDNIKQHGILFLPYKIFEFSSLQTLQLFELLLQVTPLNFIKQNYDFSIRVIITSVYRSSTVIDFIVFH